MRLFSYFCGLNKLTMNKKILLLLALVNVSLGFSQQRGSNHFNVTDHTIQPTLNYYNNFKRTVAINTGSRAACTDTIIFEDFQSKSIPGSWLNIDNDGAADANGRPQNFYINSDLQTTVGTDTNFVVSSSSWLSPFGASDNYLITQAVQPCDRTVLTWKSAPFEGLAYMDGYLVLVSTTGTNLGDFTDTLFRAAEDASAGSGVPGPGVVHSNFNGNNGVLQEFSVDLSSYDNQTIYIAFRHQSNDDNYIMFDDIFVGNAKEYNTSIVSASSNLNYFKTPINQLPTTVNFTVESTLLTDDTVTNHYLLTDLFFNGSFVSSDSVFQSFLYTGDTAQLTTNPFALGSVGNYKALFYTQSNEFDSLTEDNSDSIFFNVSDTTFATTDGSNTGTLSIGAGNAGFMGNIYELLVSDDMTSISVHLPDCEVGDSVRGVVFGTSSGIPTGNILDSTSWFVVSDSTIKNYTLQLVNAPLTLAPGKYLVGVEETNNQSIKVATNTEFYKPNSSYVFFNGSWNTFENYSFFVTSGIEANFGDACPAPTVSFTKSITGSMVSFTNTSSTTGSTTSSLWDFGDGNTSILANPTHTYASIGTYTVCLTVTDSCATDSSCMLVNLQTTGITLNQLEGLAIYPNPSLNNFQVAGLFDGQNVELEMLSITGKIIEKQFISNQSIINTDKLTKGTYIVRIKNNLGEIRNILFEKL